jgi:hypothetical protein
MVSLAPVPTGMYVADRLCSSTSYVRYGKCESYYYSEYVASDSDVLSPRSFYVLRLPIDDGGFGVGFGGLTVS